MYYVFCATLHICEILHYTLLHIFCIRLLYIFDLISHDADLGSNQTFFSYLLVPWLLHPKQEIVCKISDVLMKISHSSFDVSWGVGCRGQVLEVRQTWF